MEVSANEVSANRASGRRPSGTAFRVCVSAFAAAALCLLGAAIAVTRLPGGACVLHASATPQDAVWTALSAAGVFGLTGLVAWAWADVDSASRRTRIVLGTVVLLEIAAAVAVIGFFAHQTYHWSDCG